MCARTTASSCCRVACAIRTANTTSIMDRAHTQQTLLHGQDSETHHAPPACLGKWQAPSAGTRIHDTTKPQVSVMFVEARPHLQPPLFKLRC